MGKFSTIPFDQHGHGQTIVSKVFPAICKFAGLMLVRRVKFRRTHDTKSTEFDFIYETTQVWRKVWDFDVNLTKLGSYKDIAVSAGK